MSIIQECWYFMKKWNVVAIIFYILSSWGESPGTRISHFCLGFSDSSDRINRRKSPGKSKWKFLVDALPVSNILGGRGNLLGQVREGFMKTVMMKPIIRLEGLKQLVKKDHLLVLFRRMFSATVAIELVLLSACHVIIISLIVFLYLKIRQVFSY